MKTIGYVLAEFPVLSETFVGTEMRGMQGLGHRIVPCTLVPSTRAYQPGDAALKAQTRYFSDIAPVTALLRVVRHLVRWPRALPFLFRQKGLSKKSLLLQAARLVAIIERENITHLHAHFALASAATAIVAARLAGVSVSFVGHGFDIYSCAVDLPLKLTDADFSIAVCAQTEEDLRRQAPEATVFYMPCGVDLARFTFTEPVAPVQPHFLFVGRFCEKKGIDVLLRAFSLLMAYPGVRLDLVGDGPLLGEMRKLAVSLGVDHSVNFLGAMPSEWLIENGPRYCALVAPFRIAADGDRDTGPLVIKEAMALGLPVITSDLMGCREMVTNDTGDKLPVDNVEVFAQSMKRHMDMPLQERALRIRRARLRVESLFTVEKCVRTLSDAIESVHPGA